MSGGRLTQRVVVPEHMDAPDIDRAELADALAFIRAVNRRLGGTRATVARFERWARGWAPGETIRVLDVGTGSADVPLALLDRADRAGWSMEITAVDVHETTLALAREHAGARPGLELVRADARRLTEHFEPGSFDYVHAALFLHHLPDVELLTVLRIMDRLARRGVLWNDLVRGPIERVGVRLLALAASPTVRHDAIVSVEQGFTRREAMDLARRVGLEAPRYRRHLLGRFTLWSTKRPAPVTASRTAGPGDGAARR